MPRTIYNVDNCRYIKTKSELNKIQTLSLIFLSIKEIHKYFYKNTERFLNIIPQMDNDSRILDDLLFTSDIESETVNTTENTINSSIVTQNNIESFENIDANG